ncbi:MAG: LolA family protein [Planctomycetota bacterium]|jgi:outer membrane lipoprotein-sorting protein
MLKRSALHIPLLILLLSPTLGAMEGEQDSTTLPTLEQAAEVEQDSTTPPTLEQAAAAGGVPVADEPDAHALYDGMFEAMKEADSLHYEGTYEMPYVGIDRVARCRYKMWLKKPNFFRMEATSDGELKGVLVGDGENLWIYWPAGRPNWDHSDPERQAKYAGSEMTSYMTKPTPVGRHSISHEAGRLGGGIAMLILEPSAFHDYTDSLQQHLDGVRALAPETIDGEEFDLIEVSYMKGQRHQVFWVSRRDGLPRRQKQFIYVRYTHITTETWENVVVNGDMGDDLFKWTPPEGWREYKMADPDERLLKPGTQAPDFDLASMDGGRIKLSDYRGKVVWFYVWRAG